MLNLKNNINRGGTAVVNAEYGAGSGSILLDDVECKGTESSIEECFHTGWGVSNCYHGEDAGVRCKIDTSTLTPGSDDWLATFSPGNIYRIIYWTE